MNDNEPKEHDVTIYADHPVTRRLFKHIVISEKHGIEEYHATLVAALTALYDRGITEAVLVGSEATWLLTWAPPPNPKEPPDG